MRSRRGSWPGGLTVFPSSCRHTRPFESGPVADAGSQVRPEAAGGGATLFKLPISPCPGPNSLGQGRLRKCGKRAEPPTRMQIMDPAVAGRFRVENRLRLRARDSPECAALKRARQTHLLLKR